MAETGVGTVAAGVAKAYADYVLIAGHNGGTGASPLSSIKHAGSPWELGLAEAQATLVRNGLRHRIEVRTDGGLKTGRDVVIAALLGAESYGFGTAPLVAMGCAMARQCHINTCPTGIATQREDLRAKFKGTPEQVITYFTLLAEEVRRILAAHGRPQPGRDHRPQRPARSGSSAPRSRGPRCSTCRCCWRPRRAPVSGGRRRRRRTDRETTGPAWCRSTTEILARARAVPRQRPAVLGQLPDPQPPPGGRAPGWRAPSPSGTATRVCPQGAVRLRFTGSAGQSFGAFTCRGMHLELEGEANDYVGKGLSGGELDHPAVPPRGLRRRLAPAPDHRQHGPLRRDRRASCSPPGQAGDRFAVRNSGAIAVIEGAGNHCCEYMTGGIVVVLGRAGRNFGAGMSNGVAYVIDEAGTFESRVNQGHGRAGGAGRGRHRRCCAG